VNPAPDALLLIAPGCPHCPAIFAALGELVKAGRIGRLEVVNIAEHPNVADTVGTRTVPWYRIGGFEFEGVMRPSELTQWTDRARNGTGMNRYLSRLLETQRLAKVMELVAERPARLSDLVSLIANLETPMSVRIGVGEVFEDMAGSAAFTDIVPALGALTGSEESQVRADAAHYLGLSGNPAAADFLRPLLEDADSEVREIAAESLPLVHSTDR